MQSGLPFLAKRLLDRGVAATLLVMTSPLMAAAVIATRVTVGAPAIFSQLRPGLGGKPFRVYKIRSMTDAVDDHGNLRPDAERLTRLGRFLRATSIDELPQLYNVLRGEISLVGPRPLLMEYLERYTPEQARRHDVLPGVTGWAQIHGRNAMTWERKFELDVWYVDHWSFWLDCKILWATVAPVLLRTDVSSTGHATMPIFSGTVVNQDDG